MHAAVLFIHSLLRWAVLAAGLYAVAAAARGKGRAGRYFPILLDIQVVAGLLLYGLSPITSSAIGNLGAAMQNRVVRFWAVEHVFTMLVALALAHIGLSRAKAGKGGVALLYLLALVAVLVGTPWPFFPYGRPLLPMP
jgi:hypothetical protein